MSDKLSISNRLLFALALLPQFFVGGFLAASFCQSTVVAQEMILPEAQLQQADGEQSAEVQSEAPTKKKLQLIELLIRGGWLMVPLLVLSVVVVTLVFERLLGTRQSRILPDKMLDELHSANALPGVFDPRRVFKLTSQYPSTASSVLRSMLLKVGRPLNEVQRAVKEANEREADRLYSKVRWLNLAAAIAPLIGLLGTVWGMIIAFHETTQLQLGQNKADYLAEGIYLALVTTLAGLAVAIPAAIFSHYFEGRIHKLFHQIDELMLTMIPQMEQYEGRVRINAQALQRGEFELRAHNESRVAAQSQVAKQREPSS